MNELDRMAADAKTALSQTMPTTAKIRERGDKRRAKRRRRNRIGLLAAGVVAAVGVTTGIASLWPEQSANVVAGEAGQSPVTTTRAPAVELIIVPDVIGLQVEEAVVILETRGLGGLVGADGGIPPSQGWGRIISTDPPAGAEVDPGTIILIGVGPPPRTGGNLEEPAFSGDTWELIVGEDANGDSGTFKVCHAFFPADEPPTQANGLDTSGCSDWPSATHRDVIIVDAVSALRTADAVVLFVDLGVVPVETVVALLADGTGLEVTPFTMPQSRKQFAVIEIPDNAAAIALQAIGPDGTVLDTRDITDRGGGE